MLQQLKKDLQALANPEKAAFFPRFFKTGKGEYGEGDEFIGITVPNQRAVAKKYINIPLGELQKLQSSRIHEHRLTALIILTYQYKKATDQQQKKKLFEYYLHNISFINNWDLVDLSAPNIVGEYLLDKDKSLLYSLAKSENVWERRIAMISTYTFIRHNQFDVVFDIGALLLKDRHDLIHKAVGWMLREIGKRNQQQEELFLKKHYKTMPRTMLRYAIERFEESKRKKYLLKDTTDVVFSSVSQKFRLNAHR